MSQNFPGKLYRFGAFEADEKTGELRKQGRRLALQGQPLQVLLMLLRRPGDLVTRTEIQQALWPDGTFVDFDHGLNTAINKIREALGDSAASPLFVETLAKRGYRFMASVEVLNGDGTPAAAAPAKKERSRASAPTGNGPDLKPAEASASGFAQGLLTRADQTPHAPDVVVRLLLLLLQAMYLVFYIEALAHLRGVEHVASIVLSAYLRIVILVIVTAAVGIPIRLYLISGAAFRPPGLRANYLKLFPMIFLLDVLWALAPFMLINKIGFGLALAATAALLYAPFAQRSLVLMSHAPSSHSELPRL
ncbi:MAG: winged helix-turn-helix domain-containing protein [Candidatus Acidiferrales bacterium]